jgi:hypothetical protein
MGNHSGAVTGSLPDVVGRAAERASARTLVICALAGLVALLVVVLWVLVGRRGQWQLPLGAGALAGLAFGLGGLAHQGVAHEQSRPTPDRRHLTALRVVERACILSGAAGAIVVAGRALMALYGSSFWN